MGADRTEKETNIKLFWKRIDGTLGYIERIVLPTGDEILFDRDAGHIDFEPLNKYISSEIDGYVDNEYAWTRVLSKIARNEQGVNTLHFGEDEVESQVDETHEGELTTVTSFSGADMVPTLNGVPIGEIQEITYKESLVPGYDETGMLLPPIKGEVHQVVFDEEPATRGLIQDNNKLILFFADEFGKKASLSFIGVSFTERTGGVAVDHLVIKEIYHFIADDVVYDQRKWEYDGERYIFTE
jgi:hypothetical protein